MLAGELWRFLTQNIELLMLAMARPFGFSVLFTPFAWGGLNSGMLRMVFVLSISLPLMQVLTQTSLDLLRISHSVVAILLFKELFLGAVLGWVCSKPFEIAAGGGHIVDSYRNASSGDTDPSGGQITAYSKVFLVAALLQFSTIGGFWIIADILYKSIEIWPLHAKIPIKPASELGSIVELTSLLIVGAMIVAGPLVIVMIVSDAVFLFAAKFGKSINTFHLAFTVKNLIAICLLPLFILVFQKFFTDQALEMYKILEVVASVFK